jgi:hypothetical protein
MESPKAIPQGEGERERTESTLSRPSFLLGWHPASYWLSHVSWWTSRDQSGISGLGSGRFDLHHGHRAAKPESARMSFGLCSASGNF